MARTPVCGAIIVRITLLCTLRVATHHLTEAAALWFPSVESQVTTATWEQFCALVRDRFDRDQHELLVRQLLHIRQTSSVSDYVAHFTSLVDQLKAYSKGVDPVYFTSRFIDGLRADLRASIIVQRPKAWMLLVLLRYCRMIPEVPRRQLVLLFLASHQDQHCHYHYLQARTSQQLPLSFQLIPNLLL